MKKKPVFHRCHYCPKMTVWVRSLNGQDIYVCFDCVDRFDNELRKLQRLAYEKRKGQTTEPGPSDL